MKRILVILFVFLSIPLKEFAQFREDELLRNSPPQIATHEKTAQWPAQSFYQRKSEWQWIVDSTWGPGVSTSQKIQIFNTYANFIQTRFALFHRLNLDWDSLRTFWRSKITDSTSNGALHQIMSHLAWSLKDGHSASWNVAISYMPLNPGTPLFLIPSYAIMNVSHFGASLTANSEGEIFVFKTIANHPLGLEPGDVIVGYEGVKWIDIVEELMDFHIPIFGASSTNEEARNHDLLISAGMNWHMFSTIDIIKHSTGDTLNLTLEPMRQIFPEDLVFAEQMDILGVPKPDYGQLEPGSYGIIENQNIGYIYIYNHMTGLKTINQIFLEAVQNLYNTDGLIIDLRSDVGGYLDMDLNGGLDLLFNKKITELKYVIRCNGSDLYSLCYANSWFNITPNPQTFFQKPIAILIGPKCMSMGDFTAHRLKSFPNGKFFGRTSSGALGITDGYYDVPGLPGNYAGWVFYTQVGDSYHPNTPYQYLSGKDFPVDEEIWLTKEDVANGYDTVVEEAVSWIKNLSHCYNPTIDKTYTQDEIEITADVKNPNNHSLSISADILKNDLVIDSLDCTIVGNKISGTWTVPVNSEDFYSVTIRTKDNEDSTVHTLPNITRFTTAGPVVLDSISYTKTPTYYSVKTFIRNQSTNTTITKTSVKLICDDPWVLPNPSNVRNLPNIPPAGITYNTFSFSVKYIDSLFPGYFNFKVEVISDGWTYWEDSTQVIVTGVEEALQQPLTFKLEQNYPNPFNPSTRINWQSPVGSHATLKVFNILGGEEATLVDEYRAAGKYETEFNAANLPSGVYFYRVQAGSFVQIRKMILLK